MVDFKAKIKDVPDNPGVYMMLDDRGEIIYVGKAKNLKNRLRSYFFNLSGRPKKVSAMLEHVADFRYIICASEVDALLTENNLIKSTLRDTTFFSKTTKRTRFCVSICTKSIPRYNSCASSKTTAQSISDLICNRSTSEIYST